MSPPTGPSELDGIRVRLDAVDRRMIELLGERHRLISEVIAFKRSKGMAVVDRDREEAMLRRAEDIADGEGLDPRVARQVLRAVIDAFTLVEVEHLGDDD
jgi:chorismate mutase